MPASAAIPWPCFLAAWPAACWCDASLCSVILRWVGPMMVWGASGGGCLLASCCHRSGLGPGDTWLGGVWSPGFSHQGPRGAVGPRPSCSGYRFRQVRQGGQGSLSLSPWGLWEQAAPGWLPSGAGGSENTATKACVGPCTAGRPCSGRRGLWEWALPEAAAAVACLRMFVGNDLERPHPSPALLCKLPADARLTGIPLHLSPHLPQPKLPERPGVGSWSGLCPAASPSRALGASLLRRRVVWAEGCQWVLQCPPPPGATGVRDHQTPWAWER